MLPLNQTSLSQILSEFGFDLDPASFSVEGKGLTMESHNALISQPRDAKFTTTVSRQEIAVTFSALRSSDPPTQTTLSDLAQALRALSTINFIVGHLTCEVKINDPENRFVSSAYSPDSCIQTQTRPPMYIFTLFAVKKESSTVFGDVNVMALN